MRGVIIQIMTTCRQHCSQNHAMALYSDGEIEQFVKLLYFEPHLITPATRIRAMVADFTPYLQGVLNVQKVTFQTWLVTFPDADSLRMAQTSYSRLLACLS